MKTLLAVAAVFAFSGSAIAAPKDIHVVPRPTEVLVAAGSSTTYRLDHARFCRLTTGGFVVEIGDHEGRTLAMYTSHTNRTTPTPGECLPDDLFWLRRDEFGSFNDQFMKFSLEKTKAIEALIESYRAERGVVKGLLDKMRD